MGSLSQLIWSCDAAELPWNRYVCLVLGLFASSWGIGMVVTDLSIVLAFVGATTSTLLGYVLPAWFYLKIYPEQTWERSLAWVVFFVGLLLIPTLFTIEIL